MKPAPSSRTLRIGGTAVARTPLTVPSFSSQALPSDRLGETVSSTLEAVVGPILISAFDLHHGHFGETDEQTLFDAPLTFIDSGGYEGRQIEIKANSCEAENPLTSGVGHMCSHRSIKPPISKKEYFAVLDEWPDGRKAIAVNFDCATDDVSVQLSEALSLAHGRSIGRELILKPNEMALQRLVENLRLHRTALKELSAVGITEKEAGDTLIERLTTIRALRVALNDLELSDLPIHVFGGLDPLRSPLYFLAGADIFDGLSWLRYGYEQGHAEYLDALAAIRYPEVDLSTAKWKVRRQNFAAVTQMQTSMLRFLATKKAKDLHPDAELLIKILEQVPAS